MDLSPEQIAKLTARLGRDIEGWLRDRTVEKHYSVDALAELLDVAPRTVWSWIDAYETSGGKQGLGPTVKLSHKCVRIPASAVNAMLKRHTIDAAALSRPNQEEAA